SFIMTNGQLCEIRLFQGQEISKIKQKYLPEMEFGGGVFIHPDIDFVMGIMKNFKKPWFIAGG
ncbi:hypothetical protein, partial [Brevibacillus centrosporus]|uniref:hypothetical protein n=1 Tax=Brevibacillus centrosporus TaxID=54910 RepID=UPI002E1CB213|nr:hypothetical protein [Brevibacillus centrosporus]